MIRKLRRILSPCSSDFPSSRQESTTVAQHDVGGISNGTSHAVSLSELDEGAWGTVVSTEPCCEDCDFLRALGMTERSRFRVCRRGEPCIVQVCATRLGMSREVSDRILVEPHTTND